MCANLVSDKRTSCARKRRAVKGDIWKQQEGGRGFWKQQEEGGRLSGNSKEGVFLETVRVPQKKRENSELTST